MTAAGPHTVSKAIPPPEPAQAIPEPPATGAAAEPARPKRSRAISPPTDHVGPIRMVAIDIDGTLLRTDKRLSMRCVRAVNEATRRGVRVVLASARPPRSMREVYHHLKLDTVQINYNGALIHDLPRYRHLFHCPLPSRLALRIVRMARRLDPGILVSAEILDRWYTDRVDPSLATETSRRHAPDHLGPIEEFLNVPVTKLMLLGAPDRLDRIHDALRARFARKVGLLVSDRHLLQIVNRRVDKAHALARVAEDYGIPRAEVMAIGDAPNDVGMLRWAGLGAAVQNAWTLARNAADRTVPSNDNDGVAWAIEQYVLR